MAAIAEPTQEQREAWAAWVAERPEPIRAVIEAHGLNPWTLYRLKSSKHRVTIYSLSAGPPVTLTVSVSGKFNALAFERNVFGIAPEDLEECDLPGPNELVGSLDMPIEEAVRRLRAEEAKPGSGRVRVCSQKQDPEGFLCTEEPGHLGDHVARDLQGAVRSQWPRSSADVVYGPVPEDHYRCAICKDVCEKGWSEEEAKAEAKANFGPHYEPQESELVCDDCYNRVKAEGGLPS